MREILFRGKRTDNGEWIYGDLMQNVDCIKIREQEKDVKHIAKSFEIDLETVGQYTDLTDKNGKRIFEGDIVHCLARMDEANCVVIFEEGEFRLVPERNCKTYVTGGGYHALRCFVKEVIGNIHDNPELLKGGEV